MILSLVFIYFVAWVALMIRIKVVGDARLSIIRRVGRGNLPTFEAAMFNPRYYLLWTEAQWTEWMEAQS